MKTRRRLIIGLLLFGLYVRFANVGQKVYTVDEVRGLLRASGVTSQEFVETVYSGEPITSSELQQYQTASVGRPFGDALSALANNPEHPPLYYLMMRFSLQLFQTAAASRWLTVGFSLLLLPAVYWLCQILFASAPISSAAIGWSTVALMTVSPFHVLLAQEARQYSIWALLTVISSAFLLKALQLNPFQPNPFQLNPFQLNPLPSNHTSDQAPSQATNQKNTQNNTWIPWLGYGISATLGMYSHLFFTWVLVTHGLYVVVSEKFRLSQKLLRYIVTSAGISLAFSPWVWVVFSRREQLSQTTKWASTYSLSLLERAETWLHNLGIGFIDFNWAARFDNPIPYLILGAIAYSTYQLYRHTPKKVWLFIVLLMAVSSLAQVVPDLLQGGRRSLLPRYSLTAYLGIELAIGYAIAQALTSQPATSHTHTSTIKRKGKQLAAITLLVGGIVSSSLITQSLGWGKGSSKLILKAVPFINQTTAPLVLTEADHTYILSLTHKVKPKTQFILLNREQNPDYAAALSHIPAGSDFFVYWASDPMVEFLQTAPDISLKPQTKEMSSALIYQAKRR